MNPPSWQAQTDRMNRAEKAKGRKKTGTVLERDIEKAIREAFRLRYRILLFKTDAGGAGWRSVASEGAGGHSGLPNGFPDLLGVIPGNGRVIVIECKRPGNKPTANQEHYLSLFRSWGGVALWADSVDSALAQFEEQTRCAA